MHVFKYRGYTYTVRSAATVTIVWYASMWAMIVAVVYAAVDILFLPANPWNILLCVVAAALACVSHLEYQMYDAIFNKLFEADKKAGGGDR